MSNELSSWSDRNCLSIHPLKSTLMILSSKSFTGLLSVVTLGGVPLVMNTNATCLGVKIDNKLSWKDHISYNKTVCCQNQETIQNEGHVS